MLPISSLEFCDLGDLEFGDFVFLRDLGNAPAFIGRTSFGLGAIRPDADGPQIDDLRRFYSRAVRVTGCQFELDERSEIDPQTAIVGALHLYGADIALQARNERGTAAYRIGNAPEPGPSREVAFARWRLITMVGQERVVVYERSGPTG